MNRRSISLIEVLQPRSFQLTPERARATRTIMQPEIDSFELMEAQDTAQGKPARTPRQDSPGGEHRAGA